jgi:hypothetical protein
MRPAYLDEFILVYPVEMHWAMELVLVSGLSHPSLTELDPVLLELYSSAAGQLLYLSQPRCYVTETR